MENNLYYLHSHGIVAKMRVQGNTFTVLAGSGIRMETSEHVAKKMKEIRAQYMQDETIKEGQLTRDLSFTSASTAATFVIGNSANGMQMWKDNEGMPLAGYKWKKSNIDPRTGEIQFGSFFATAGGNEGSKCFYPTRLDTYGCGCGHNCSYCYARSLQSFREQWDPLKPKVADIRRIERKIKKLPKHTVLRLGGMTDCFQPCEKTFRTTYETIKILNKYDIEYLIVTKSDLVASDEYIEIMRKDLAHIQISVTSTDDKKSAMFEKAPAPSKRIAAIEKLYDAGFDVCVRLSPYIEGFIDLDIIEKIRCDKALVEFLRVDGKIRQWFDIDYSDYELAQSSAQHLTLEKKLQLLSQIKGFSEISVCDDYTDHYEYFKHNFNPNPNDCCNLNRK